MTLFDTQCGFKLIDRARLRPLIAAMRVDGFAWDVELLFLCRRFGLSVGEVPIRWIEQGSSHVRFLKHPWPMLWEISRLRWRFRSGGYDAVGEVGH